MAIPPVLFTFFQFEAILVSVKKANDIGAVLHHHDQGNQKGNHLKHRAVGIADK